MTDTPKGKIVYSTERGRTCQRCGRPEKECRCAIKAEQAVPARIVAHLRIEKKGRGGKTVTVVDNLPRNPEFLKQLAAELKRACGSGGTAGDASIEIQGDHRDALRACSPPRGGRSRADPATMLRLFGPSDASRAVGRTRGRPSRLSDRVTASDAVGAGGVAVADSGAGLPARGQRSRGSGAPRRPGLGCQ